MSRAELDALIDEHGPLTVFAAVRPLLSDARLERIDAVLAARLSSLTVVVENLYDPHNGAAALRSVEAFGLSAIHAIEAANAFPISGDVTIGADKWIDVHRYPDAGTCARALRDAGFRLAATTPDAAVPIGDLDIGHRWAIWFGNERDGLSDEALALADERVVIPMQGFTRSFNVSVSVALAVSQLSAARRAHIGRDGDLAAKRIGILRARFAATQIRGLKEIVLRHVSE